MTPAFPWKPLMACSYRTGLPWAIRGPQAPLSPNLGAPAIPAPWHATHAASYSFLPASTVLLASVAGAVTAAAVDTDVGAGEAAAGTVAAVTAGCAAGAGAAGSLKLAPLLLAM